MGASVDAQGFQRLQVELLGIPGVGFEDDLELRVPLHSVGIEAVAGVIWPHRRLRIAHVPRLRAEDTEKRRGVHGAGANLQGAWVGRWTMAGHVPGWKAWCTCRAHLGVVRQPDHASSAAPELLQTEYGLLEGRRVAAVSSVAGGGRWGSRR